MKTTTTLALATIATSLFTSGVFAGDIDNHHGSVTYARPAQTEIQKPTTVAVYANGQAVGRTNASTAREALTFRQVSTPHGTISYFAPAE